jgi:ATP-binding cassette subfamily B protein
MEHAERLDVAYFEAPKFQDTLERARQNTTFNLLGLLSSTLMLITNVLQILSLTAILFMLEPLALIVLLPFALLHFFFQWSISKKYYEDERARATKRRWTRYFTSLVTTRELVPEVKLLDLGPVVIGRFRRFMSDFRDRNRDRHMRSFAGGSVFAVLTVLAVYFMFGRVVGRVLRAELSVGDIAVFAVAALRLRNALETVVLSTTRGMTQALQISNLREFLEVKPMIERGVGRAAGITRGAVVLDGVTFTYAGAREPALRDVSLTIAPGEVVALVGRNGAGKTTLVRLLARFYDPDAGAIRIDGNDLRELSQQYLHDHIGFVFQQPTRYETTARENIAYGRWRVLLENGGNVEEIARRAGVTGIIDSLPHGYDTQLGRDFGEIELSLGLWQQRAIARALARDAAVLILDEPAASLDAEAEYELFCGSRRLAAGRTTILISHRFSTVSMADRIVVLDGGRIVESGTHAELIARAGIYARLYSLQQRQMVNAAK